MGHIINATAFRLGKTKKTSSIWSKKNSQYKFFFFKDFLISRFIKNFFITYNIPVFSFTRIRVKNTGKDDIYPNPWISNGFVFSNCVITRDNKLNIHSFFLDSILEELRTKDFYSVKGISYLNFPKYKKRNWAYNPFDYFYKNKIKIRKKYKNQKKRFYKRTKNQYLKRKLFFYNKRLITKKRKEFSRRKYLIKKALKKREQKYKAYLYNIAARDKYFKDKNRKEYFYDQALRERVELLRNTKKFSKVIRIIDEYLLNPKIKDFISNKMNNLYKNINKGFINTKNKYLKFPIINKNTKKILINNIKTILLSQKKKKL